MTGRLSGSSLYRVEACGGELVLPNVPEAENAYASLGSIIHAFLRDVSVLGLAEALAKGPEEHRDALAAIEVSALPACQPDQYASEVAFAYDWRHDKARELGRGLNRDYSGLTADELPGTADVVGLTAEAVVVLDYKSGWKPLGRPRDSLQLLFYALAAARTYGRDRAVVGFIRRLDGDPIYTRAELDMLDLDAAAARIRALMERPAPAVPGGLVQGAHCQYCPAFGQCPAKLGLVRGLFDGELPALDADTAPLVFERLVLAEEVLERVRHTVQEYARSKPIRLPDGKVFGLKDCGVESIDPDLGAPVLAEAFGPEVVAASVEVEKKLTKAALGRALRTYQATHPGTKITKLQQHAMELLRTAGAAVKKWHQEMKVFTPPPPALPAGEK